MSYELAMQSKIPNEIQQYLPEKCSIIKLIGGHYYVYRYKAIKLQSGKWGTKTDSCIGKIIPNIGFCPNKNYDITDETITILEYGQYGLLYNITNEIIENLKACFPLEKASQIYSYAMILYANNFVHLDQVQSYFEQSWLSLEYKDFSSKMGKTALGNLLDDLGRKQLGVIKYQNNMIKNSSSQVAIDGHVIRSLSEENDLADHGYKFTQIKGEQVNLITGYDINIGIPLFSKFYRGSDNDKVTIENIFETFAFNSILFVIDRGFYSAHNLKLFSSDNNAYIVPVPSNTNIFKIAMSDLSFTSSFYYRAGKKHARVEYKKVEYEDSDYVVYVYRDIDENEKCRYNYRHQMDLGVSGYTIEGFENSKEFFGVYVLQTSKLDFTAEEVFDRYKNRWSIETYYQYVKNKGDFNNLMFQDYYKEEGFAFILLIVGQIHHYLTKAVRRLGNNTISNHDALLMARRLKMSLRNNVWNLHNTRKKELDILSNLGFIPKTCIKVNA